MNGYERALATLSFQKTDRVATWGGWIANVDFFERVTGRDYWKDPRRTAFDAYRAIQVDLVVQDVCLPPSPQEWRKHTDETLVGHQKYGTPEQVCRYVEALPSDARLAEGFDLQSEMQVALESYMPLQRELGNEIFCLPQFACANFTWFREFGYTSYLAAMALYPEVIGRLLRHDAERQRLKNMALAELVKQGSMQPFFMHGTDICGMRGPMASPQTLRRLFFPGLKRALEPLVEIGADLIWHSDGYIIPLVDDLIGCGITGFQGFQENTGFDVTDIAAKSTRKREKPIIMAGLSVTDVLRRGTVSDTEHEVERIIDSVGRGGGLLIGTASTADPDCRVENLQALYRHTHTYGARA